MATTVNIPLPTFGPPAQQPEQEDERIRSIRSTHSDYDTFLPLWQFYLSAYEGGKSFCRQDYIFKHARENQADYDDRVKRIHNLNYCEPLVDFFTNFIFSESIDRNGGANNGFYQSFIKDVNKKGDSVDDFMRQVSDDMQIFGMSYVLVDAPVSTDQMVSKYDEAVKGIRPYWVLVRPTEILDWVIDDFGKYLYVKRRQYRTELVGKERRDVEVYTEFYPEAYVVSKVDVSDPHKPKWLGQVELVNSLKTIPLRTAVFKHSKEYPNIGLSFLRDFAFNNREIMNLTSLLQEFLYRQAFNILAKEVDTSLPELDQTEGEVGTSNAITYPKGAKAPSYITPPADPAKFIQDERARIKNEMFVRAAQDALNELFNGEKASGFSQAQSFSKTAPFIASRADTLERVENELMDLTLKMMGKSWNGKIKYKDNYAITNLSDALTQFQILVRDLQMPSETFVKAELKRLIHEFDGKLPSDELAKIEKEIEDMSFTGWAKTQKEALVGKQATPGNQQKTKSTGTMLEAAAEAKVDNTAATKKVRGQQPPKQ